MSGINSVEIHIVLFDARSVHDNFCQDCSLFRDIQHLFTTVNWTCKHETFISDIYYSLILCSSYISPLKIQVLVLIIASLFN